MVMGFVIGSKTFVRKIGQPGRNGQPRILAALRQRKSSSHAAHVPCGTLTRSVCQAPGRMVTLLRKRSQANRQEGGLST